jgi:hypothetical protein
LLILTSLKTHESVSYGAYGEGHVVLRNTKKSPAAR